MKNLYVDLGAHKGATIRWFLKNYPEAESYEIVAFEPNAALAKHYPDCVEHVAAGAYDADGKKQFYRTKDNVYGAGCGFWARHKLDHKNPIEVPTLNFSAWLMTRCEKIEYGNVVVKMNIESAEYAVLLQMLVDQSLNLVDEMYVKFHAGKMNYEPWDLLHKYLARNLKLFPTTIYQSNIDEDKVLL